MVAQLSIQHQTQNWLSLQHSHNGKYTVERVHEIFPSLFSRTIDLHYVSGNSVTEVLSLLDHVKELHKAKLREILALHHVVHEFGKELSVALKGTMVKLMRTLID